MLFQGRVDRAMDLQQKQHEQPEQEEQMDPKMEYEQQPLKDKLEKGDIFAMLLSATWVLIPVSLGVMLLIYFLARLILHV